MYNHVKPCIATTVGIYRGSVIILHHLCNVVIYRYWCSVDATAGPGFLCGRSRVQTPARTNTQGL